MNRWGPLLVVFALLAGCVAAGDEDPFAYTRKPLYTGGFDLAELAAGDSGSQEFRVTDGSIAGIRFQVWVNATAGGGSVVIRDPSGREVVNVGATSERAGALELGVWTVRAAAPPGSQGRVHILVTRT